MYSLDPLVLQSTLGDPRRPGTDHSKGTVGIDSGLMLPKSTGRLCLRSRDPLDNPIYDMQHVTSPEDGQALRVVSALAD